MTVLTKRIEEVMLMTSKAKSSKCFHLLLLGLLLLERSHHIVREAHGGESRRPAELPGGSQHQLVGQAE